jgi:hypothetical protein
MIPGRVKVDITLYKITNEKKNIVAKSHSSNNELILLAEIPRGSYIIQFKFYPTSFGFTKCESVKIEFAMMNFNILRSNLNNMKFRYKKFDKNGIPINIKTLNFMNHLTKTIGDYKKILTVKSLKHNEGQDGVVVTTILDYLLSNNIVTQTLVVDKKENLAWKPYAKLTKDVDEIVKASGTKYSVCPVFKPLKQLKRDVN